MAILEHLVGQSAGKLDNLKLNKHKQVHRKTEVMGKKDVSATLGQQNAASTGDGDHDNSRAYSVRTEVANVYECRDENHEAIPFVATDGCLYTDPSCYAGFSYMPGYIPYLIDGAHYYTPYIDPNLFNQPLYNTLPLDSQYSTPGYGYGTQVYHYMPYAFYQQVPTGNQIFAPGIPNGGVMVVDPQEPAQSQIVMPSESSNGSQDAIPTPGGSTYQSPAVDEDGYSIKVAAKSVRGPGSASVESSLKQDVSPAVATASNAGVLLTNGVSPEATDLHVMCHSNGSARDCRVTSSVYISATETKVRDQMASSTITSNSSLKSSDKGLCPPPTQAKYNSTNFDVKFDQAKFFIIKSYSGNNVYRSIEYGVWASTPTGNRKLDEAYKEAQSRVSEKSSCCPVFLFFSVNGSRQFCGVAEMTGSVDYDKTMAFWEQRKWNGSFPVTWHIIKNVPNFQFRKIILENNESKPVTNSRDTQEVNLQQGLEMLSIFKGYNARTSILDECQMLAIQNGIQPIWVPQDFVRIGEQFNEWEVAMGAPAAAAKLSCHVPKLHEHVENPKASQEKGKVGEADGKKA